MEELKSCPFCGEQPLTLNGNAFCLSSDCCGGMLQFPIAAWNRRPLPAEQTGGWRSIQPIVKDLLVLSRRIALLAGNNNADTHRDWSEAVAAIANRLADAIAAPPVVDDKTEKEGT